MRPATLADAELLYQWRVQDEDAPWWQGDAVSPDRHDNWFRDRLISPSVLLLVGEIDGLPVGQARVDSNGEVSFSVAREHRRHGYGRQLVTLATRQAFLRHGRAKASVDRSNLAGRETLVSAGYAERPDVLFMRYPR